MYQRMMVPQAAQALGLTEGAIRQRIQRGTLEHEKGDDGRVYVLVRRENEGQNTVLTDSSSEAVDILREQNEWLRREVERKDAIILSLTQRVPELEPAPDERNAPLSASEEPGRGTVPPEREKPFTEEETRRRSWWQKMFGG